MGVKSQLQWRQIGLQPFIIALFSVRRHRVQMYILVGLPSRITVWRCTLASQRVRVCRFEWLTLFPDCPALAQIWHRAMLTT